jgi:hypothetical protein
MARGRHALKTRVERHAWGTRGKVQRVGKKAFLFSLSYLWTFVFDAVIQHDLFIIISLSKLLYFYLCIF